MHPDELTQAVRDKQVRYRHEAYGRRIVHDPPRRRLGTHLIHWGESLRGKLAEEVESPGHR